jgi:hypothetical protein
MLRWRGSLGGFSAATKVTLDVRISFGYHYVRLGVSSSVGNDARA